MSKRIKGLTSISKTYQNYFFDLDGVLWRGKQNIEGALQTMNFLRHQGKRLFFVTNASIRCRKNLVKRLGEFGFKSNIDQCYPSPYIGALYLKEKYPEIKKIMAFGPDCMVKELTRVGIEVNHVKEISEEGQPIKILDSYMDMSCQAVVLGWDKYMNYSKATLASLHVQRGLKFFKTNPDRFSMVGGYKIPSCGSIAKIIQSGTSTEAEYFGKPNTFIIDHLLQSNELKKSESLMIGDNLETDMIFGNRAKISTLCVLSGVTTEAQVHQSEGDKMPRYYCSSLIL